jgi:hypothetical protein
MTGDMRDWDGNSLRAVYAVKLPVEATVFSTPALNLRGSGVQEVSV